MTSLNDDELLGRIDPICEKFESQWQSGDPPSIDDFLDGIHGAERQLLLKYLIELDVEYRRIHGTRSDLEFYVDEYPELASGIRVALRRAEQSTLAEGKNEHATLTQAGVTKAASYKFDAAGALDIQQIGDYEIQDRIGRGGMGVVFRARQISLNRLVAVKTIRTGEFADEEEVARFRAEAEAAAGLSHPGIVPVYEVGSVDGLHYFSMGLVEGRNLSQRFSDGVLEPEEAAALVGKIATAVQYAHEKGVIHRDLKPGNVLLGDSGEPRVTDFGLAKQVKNGSDLTATGQILGTPSYMPPEQAKGLHDQIDATADVYALGAILYKGVTGRPPFQADNALDTIRQVLEREPVPPRQLNPKVPKDLDTICLKCLEKDPKRRYRSAQELFDELQRFIEQRPIVARPLNTPERAWRWCRRQPLVAGLIATAALCLIAGTVVSSYYGMLANQRANRLDKANKDLEVANLREKAAAEEARDSAELALETLETVVFDIADGLSGRTGVQDVRRDLLQRALRGLDQVSSRVASSERVSLDTAQTLLGLGEAYQQVGDAGDFDAIEGALAQYERAGQIYSRLAGETSGDDNEDARFGLALAELGKGFLLLDVARYDEALAPLEHSESILRDLRMLNPDNARNEQFLVDVIMFKGAVYYELQAYPSSEEAYLEAIEIVKPRTDSGDDSGDRRRLGTALEFLADLKFAQQDLESAKTLLEQSKQITSELIEEEGPTGEYLSDAINSAERLGDLAYSQGDLATARLHYDEVMALNLQLNEFAGDNLDQIEGMAVAWDKMAKLESAEQNLSLAIENWTKACNLRVQVLERAPSDLWVLNNHCRTANNLARGHERNGAPEKAIQVYETVLSQLDHLEQIIGENNTISENRTRVLSRLDAVQKTP